MQDGHPGRARHGGAQYGGNPQQSRSRRRAIWQKREGAIQTRGRVVMPGSFQFRIPSHVKLVISIARAACRRFVASCAAAVCLFALVSASMGEASNNGPPAANSMAPPRAGTELFVDDLNVARREKVTRNVHAATKLDHPVIEPDKPWEGSY